MLEAFDYGTPPHGGLAFGLDRLSCCWRGRTTSATSSPSQGAKRKRVMSGAPDTVDDSQLEELSIKVWDYKDK